MLTDFAKPIKSKATRIDLEKQNERLKKEVKKWEAYAHRLRKQLQEKRKQLKILENDYAR